MNRIEKLNGIQKDKSLDAFLFTSELTVKYFSGYFFYFEHGISPYHLVPALLTVIPQTAAALILADNESGDPVFSGIEVLPYPSYRFEEKPDPAAAALTTLAGFFHRHALKKPRIGVELSRLPYVVSRLLAEIYPGLDLVDVTEEIAMIKCVKDEDEIAAIRAAARLADLGQNMVFESARPGMTELQLFSMARSVMESSVGARVPLMADLSAGEGTAGGGGKPTGRILKQGDLVLSDFTPCLDGYWGDSCNTMVLGKPTAGQQDDFSRVEEALRAGIDAVRPGAAAADIDRVMREIAGGYGHHSGHGVGTAYHEHPWMVGYEKMELKSGMVIALEPAIYRSHYGIRLEHLVRVTESGAELLTNFKHRFVNPGN